MDIECKGYAYRRSGGEYIGFECCQRKGRRMCRRWRWVCCTSLPPGPMLVSHNYCLKFVSYYHCLVIMFGDQQRRVLFVNTPAADSNRTGSILLFRRLLPFSESVCPPWPFCRGLLSLAQTKTYWGTSLHNKDRYCLSSYAFTPHQGPHPTSSFLFTSSSSIPLFSPKLCVSTTTCPTNRTYHHELDPTAGLSSLLRPEVPMREQLASHNILHDTPCLGTDTSLDKSQRQRPGRPRP